LNYVSEGAKKWDFWLDFDDDQEPTFSNELYHEMGFQSAENLRNQGKHIVSVVVEAGQAIWVPSGIPHRVQNLCTPTIAFAWNILLAEHLENAIEDVSRCRNRRVDPKIQIYELVWQMVLHGANDLNSKELAQMMRRIQDRETLKISGLVVKASTDLHICDECHGWIWNRHVLLKNNQEYCIHCANKKVTDDTRSSINYIRERISSEQVEQAITELENCDNTMVKFWNMKELSTPQERTLRKAGKCHWITSVDAPINAVVTRRKGAHIVLVCVLLIYRVFTLLLWTQLKTSRFKTLH